jgi:hypothetical protein
LLQRQEEQKGDRHARTSQRVRLKADTTYP